jgi:hemolysin III
MRIQSPFEEKLNAITHAIGALFGIVALVLLIVFDSHKTNWSLFSVIVYGMDLQQKSGQLIARFTQLHFGYTFLS